MAAVPELTTRHYPLLSDEERARATRFVFEKDRARFVFGRAMLPTTLGSVLGVPGARSTAGEHVRQARNPRL
jgi:hypothetical protein